MHKKIWQIFCLATVSVLPIGAMAQTPEDDRRIAEELSINNSRPVLLRTLAPKIMPGCNIRASDQELAEFFACWRNMAKQMQDFRKQHGMPDQDTFPTAEVMGMKIMPQTPLAEVVSVNADSPGANSWARDEIEIWHIYSCIAHQYGPNRFFAHYGSFGAPWPAPFPAEFMYEPGGKRATMAPDMTSLEPLDALGRFFREAKVQGLLAFTDPTQERYFFYRYESLYFVNMKRSDATDRWFDVPPWQQPPAQPTP